MKRILLVMGMVILVCQSIAFAHWMPREEMYVGGVGAGCTLGYVKTVYGEPKEKRWFNTDGVRGVTYKYSETFSVTGRTGSQVISGGGGFAGIVSYIGQLEPKADVVEGIEI